MNILGGRARTPVRRRPRTTAHVWTAAAAVVLGFTTLGSASPASADEVLDAQLCLSTVTGTMSLSTTTVDRGQSATLTWHTNWPIQCNLATLKLVGYGTDPIAIGGYNSAGGPIAAANGSITVTPNQSTEPDHPWVLRMDNSAGSKPLATIGVTVNPIGPLTDGRTSVDVTGSDQAQRTLFLRAVMTPDVTVRVASTVDLDLSGLDFVSIAPGVKIIGDRAVVPRGPRLFTTTFPRRLLMVGGTGEVGPSDRVRISGIRLDGGQGDTSAGSDALGATGISVFSSVNVEIDHNEIYGWRGTGVFVDDERGLISLAVNPNAVRIHDNFIHHNQHYREEGYGIATHLGGYALIEQNVFDYNRHALEGDGRAGTGYLAQRNLFLTNGGDNTSLTSTHMLDMHGTDSCWGFAAYCGDAGEYMEIRNNTILYDDGTGFRLRGNASIRADVAFNVWAHSQVWSGSLPLVDDGALSQTVDEDDIKEHANIFGRNTLGQTGSCDFDADAVADPFLATGVTWWYASSVLSGRWVYLNTSGKLVGELSLGDVDRDGRCDVSSGGVVYSGGVPPLHTDLLWHVANGTPYPTSSVWQIDTGGGATTVRNPGNLLYGDVLGTGDFDADGDRDVFTRTLDGSITISALDDDVLVGNDFSEGQGPAGAAYSGIGDFDGDGYDDVLWRHSNGMFEMWFAGRSLRAAPLTWTSVDPKWQVEGIDDFNGDGRADILFHNVNGYTTIWHMNGTELINATRSDTVDPSGALDPTHLWQIAGVGDLNGDGFADILWRKTDGTLTIWFKGAAAGAAFPSYQDSGVVPDSEWQVIGLGDANGDGRADIFWRHSPVSTPSGTAGLVAIWLMDGGRYIAARTPGVADGNTTLVGLLPAKGVKVRPIVNSPGNRTTARGTPVSLTLTASRGTEPYTWSVSGLPPGLSSNSAGAITGVPTATGTYTVTATATDASGRSGPVSFLWSVVIIVPDLVGYTVSQANSALAAAGLVVGSVSDVTVWDSSDGGRVMSSNPSAGSSAQPGAAVNLTIGRWGGANR